MTAAWLWARADLRSRWRSWVVLGMLAGATFGLGAAGVAGARRTSNALPRFVSAARVPTAGVLANDPSFDQRQRAAVAALPAVQAAYPFLVGVALEVKPSGFASALIPIAARSVRPMVGVLVAGRMPEAAKADEVVVDANARRRFGLGLGATMIVGQSASPSDVASAPPGLVPRGANLNDLNFRVRLRVVGIAKSVSSDTSWTPSFGFYVKYGKGIAGFVNQFVDLRRGDSDLPRFRDDVERIVGHPINVESFADLGGLRKDASIVELERNGLLLFALAAVAVGGVLVGQALVRAVSAGAGDVPTWRALGAERRIVVRALVAPAAVSAVAAAGTAILAAVALSSRFPIGLGRRYDLDPGTHADWPVLALAAVVVVVAVLATAWLSALWRTTRSRSRARPPSTAVAWAARAGLSPALLIGSRLAIEPGRGSRAVPVRSALVGAIAGVLGVVACFTFRAGIDDVIASPQRSGIVWDFEVKSGQGSVAPRDLAAIERDPNVASVLDAVWARAIRINGITNPSFGTTNVKGNLSLVILDGRAPRGPNEIAFAPATMRELKVDVGDLVTVGTGRAHTARVVGSALLPATSHTDYDQSAWMTAAGLRAALPPASTQGADELQDYVLVRWSPNAQVAAAQRRLRKLGAPNGAYDTSPTALPPAVVDLGRLRALPLSLGVFFALMACATILHALVTTVRRRKYDLAVLRTIGFTPRQCRVAIAWQATLLAMMGLAVGIPFGITTGRIVWRWLAGTFPVVYVPPLAHLGVLLVAPAAVAIANLLAAGPAHVATRVPAADALRIE